MNVIATGAVKNDNLKQNEILGLHIYLLVSRGREDGNRGFHRWKEGRTMVGVGQRGETAQSD